MDGPVHVGGRWPLNLEETSDLVRRGRAAICGEGHDLWGPVVCALAGAVNEVATLRELAKDALEEFESAADTETPLMRRLRKALDKGRA
jgi:hypothetical protein